HFGFDSLEAADPVGTVFGLETEGRVDADAEAPLRTEVHDVKNVGQEDGFACIATVAVVERLPDGGHARSVVELGARDNRVRSEQEVLAGRPARHSGRVPPDGGGVLRGGGGARIGVAEAAHTLLGEAECGGLRLFCADERKRGRNEKREYVLFHWI